ncbi:hypothetical protein [Brevibacillus dissolubilis]|uniref:hypothetical protein n=1 Tax=Brevibacillus dissolubilis TaxID=1844116 RepID=UPI001115DE39|nr:hypothetical protein [Brevibacillus dissolubilis]
MADYGLTLRYHVSQEQQGEQMNRELARVGIQLVTATGSGDEKSSPGEKESVEQVKRVDGLLLTDEDERSSEAIQAFCEEPGLSPASPPLLLLFGPHIPHGFADQLQKKYETHQAEVVRLLLYENGDRAVIGGDVCGYWVNRLRHLLAGQDVISLTCARIEADEIARAMPEYLAWKRQFYFQLGDRCDTSGARLDVVAKGLGMDRRIGHGWLTGTASCEDMLLLDWVRHQWQAVQQKTNIHRVTFWGMPTAWTPIFAYLTNQQKVCLYQPDPDTNTNDLPAEWVLPDKPQQALEGADLLVILQADKFIQEINLHHLISRMSHPIVIDACSCYPLEEAERSGLMYRTWGQNTNVWEWN